MTYEEMYIKQQELMARKEELLQNIENNLDKAEVMYKFLTDPYNQACCEMLCNLVALMSATQFKK